MKFFIWNDEEKDILQWARCATRISNWTEDRANDPTDMNECKVCRSTDTAQVASECFAYRPDIVVLDIVAAKPGLGTDKRLGITIAKRIRRDDELVPIVAVTARPDRLYEFGGDIDDPDIEEQEKMTFDQIRFAGIYHNSVMNSESTFHDLAIRPSLIQWQILTPEYVLVRKCVELLHRYADQNTELGRLADFLEALPLQPIGSWHRSLAELLATIMSEQGMDSVANGFTTMCNLFQKADPLYMAITKSRLHLSHNVQVFLLGLVAILGIDSIRQKATADLESILASSSEATDQIKNPLLSTVLTWACVGMTHDTAYLAEKGQDFIDTVSSTLSGLIPKQPKGIGHDISPLAKARFPEVKHSDVGRTLWMDFKDDGFQGKLIEKIASAVYFHDPIPARAGTEEQTIDSTRWLDFVAILSDELQDWGRVRPELPSGADDWASNPWRLFALQNVAVRNYLDPAGASLHLQFLAVDNAKKVHDALAKPGSTQVERRFEWIRSQLTKRLRSSESFTVNLQVSFSSRSVATPILKTANIRPA